VEAHNIIKKEELIYYLTSNYIIITTSNNYIYNPDYSCDKKLFRKFCPQNYNLATVKDNEIPLAISVNMDRNHREM